MVPNEAEEFAEVDGPYRVHNIKIFNRETKKYEPLELTKNHTIESHN